MKLVIHPFLGGFSLSRAAVARWAELQGRPCYFFMRRDLGKPYAPDDGTDSWGWYAYDIPNPNDVSPDVLDAQHYIDSAPDDRADPLLVQVVEELGKDASDDGDDLRIIEIPDGVEWVIEDYDGIEHVAEKHRSWHHPDEDGYNHQED